MLKQIQPSSASMLTIEDCSLLTLSSRLQDSSKTCIKSQDVQVTSPKVAAPCLAVKEGP